MWPDWANIRRLGYILKAQANFLVTKFAQRIGKFLGYFLRQPIFSFFHYKRGFKVAFDIDILRFQICFDEYIFGFVKGFDVDILALIRLGRLLWVKIADLGYKNFKTPGHTALVIAPNNIWQMKTNAFFFQRSEQNTFFFSCLDFP